MIRRLVLILTPAVPLAAEPPADLNGAWGSAAQCHGQPIKEGGTVLAHPFVIDGFWLNHGPLWCRLNWFPSQVRDTGLYTTARAQCGEDSVQGYWIAFDLAGEHLTLIWNETIINGPLKRCR